ncbi:MAG: ribosome-associated translation inhibitor RaiA [Candidatus Krumholzibacteria bacterium]|nr:ribosome-associated translation inhibitor RaiA [Candidatus Krumholzibacteria bacterium]
MKLTTTARHFETTPELIAFTDARMRKLKRFWDQILYVDVIMSVEKFRHMAEVKVHVNGHDFSAKEESDDMYSSIEKAVKNLEKQMKKFKGKLVINAHKHRKGVLKTETREKIIGSASVGAVAGLEVVEDVPRDIHELTVEEAIVLMEDEGGNFVLFNDKESRKLSLVYKRADGNYGLLEKF